MMLPLEFIRVRRRKGTIRPVYVSQDHASLAKTLISIHEEHVGKTRGELDGALGGCEELGFEYKLVRGLSAVLEERCTFDSRAVVDPIAARRAAFEEASKFVIASEDERKRILAAAAFRIGVSAEDIERSLYADLSDEQELSKFRTTQPSDLLKEYNFALSIALLAHARRMEIDYKGSDEEMSELCSKLGECVVSSSRGITKTVVEWRPTKRIGYKASLLECLLSNVTTKDHWRLAADVVYPFNSKRVYRFEMADGLEGRMIKPFILEQKIEAKAPSSSQILNMPEEDIIDVQRTAHKLGITEARVKELVNETRKEYIDTGDVLITKAKRKEIEEALVKAPDMRFKTVRMILRGLGCKNPLPVLNALGYDIEWKKDRDESEVYKIGR